VFRVIVRRRVHERGRRRKGNDFRNRWHVAERWEFVKECGLTRTINAHAPVRVSVINCYYAISRVRVENHWLKLNIVECRSVRFLWNIVATPQGCGHVCTRAHSPRRRKPVAPYYIHAYAHYEKLFNYNTCFYWAAIYISLGLYHEKMREKTKYKSWPFFFLSIEVGTLFQRVYY